MRHFPFDESASWSVDFSPAESYLAPMFYREGTEEPLEFCFWIRGGKGGLFAIIYPDRLTVQTPVPEYVLRRLAGNFASRYEAENLCVEFREEDPDVAFLCSDAARHEEANMVRWFAVVRAAPHPLSGWTAVRVGNFWDCPRAFIVFGDGVAYFLEQTFHHDADDYASNYEAYRVPLALAEDPDILRGGSTCREHGTPLPEVPGEAVQFRAERVPNRSRKWLVHKRLLAQF